MILLQFDAHERVSNIVDIRWSPLVEDSDEFSILLEDEWIDGVDIFAAE
jgi:hypothetical protein